MTHGRAFRPSGCGYPISRPGPSRNPGFHPRSSSCPVSHEPRSLCVRWKHTPVRPGLYAFVDRHRVDGRYEINQTLVFARKSRRITVGSP